MQTHGNIFAVIGSYAEPDGPGLYVCKYDPDKGALELLDHAAGLKNPTFLDADDRSRKIFAIAEGTDASGKVCGTAVSFDIHPETGKLTLIDRKVTVPSPTCHITLDNTRKCLMAASYHGGMIGLSPVSPDGRIGETADIRQHRGSSILPVQDRPRAHSVFVDRHNRYVGACDLGLDRIIMYRLDPDAGRFITHDEVKVAPGSGPRHFVFHPSFAFGYVINELNATITAFSYEEEAGLLTEIQTVTTLPESYKGENACADIHISPDGKYLYGSNRGHDSIAVYTIDPSDGRLTFVEHASTLGGHPRNFAISPDGRFLLAANRDSHNIVTFIRDPDSGRLTPAGPVLQISKPVCVKFVRMLS